MKYKLKCNVVIGSPVHHLSTRNLKLVGRSVLVGSETLVVRLRYHSEVSSFTGSRCSGKGNSTDHIVVVFLLRVEIYSLHVGVRVTGSLSLDTVTDETETMVLNSTFRGTSLHSHFLIA